MKKLIYALMMILVFAVSGCTQTIETTFYWTATGDDTSSGTATAYEMVMAQDSASIYSGSAIIISGVPTPSVAGTSEAFTATLTVQSESRYYFAIRAVDNNNNWSPYSNIATRYIPDIVPPSMIIDFRIP